MRRTSLAQTLVRRQGVQTLVWHRSPNFSLAESGIQTLIWYQIKTINFQKNNFTLSDPSPQIPYLRWARVRLNTEQILALIYRWPKIFGAFL
jgi:hypothetical protein